MIKILITGIGTFKNDGSNSITVGILGLTYIPVPMLLTGEYVSELSWDMQFGNQTHHLMNITISTDICFGSSLMTATSTPTEPMKQGCLSRE